MKFINYKLFYIIKNILNLKMKKFENDLDIYYAVGNANTVRQETEIKDIICKRNSLGWKLVNSTTSIVDNKNQFSNLYLFWEK